LAVRIVHRDRAVYRCGLIRQRCSEGRDHHEFLLLAFLRGVNFGNIFIEPAGVDLLRRDIYAIWVAKTLFCCERSVSGKVNGDCGNNLVVIEIAGVRNKAQLVINPIDCDRTGCIVRHADLTIYPRPLCAGSLRKPYGILYGAAGAAHEIQRNRVRRFLNSPGERLLPVGLFRFFGR